MKDNVHYRIGIMFGLQCGFVVGFGAGFGFTLSTGAISGFSLKWESIAYTIDKFSTPLTTIFASSIAIYGVRLAITHQDRLAEGVRKNKLMATRASLITALVDLEGICKDYTLMACHGSKFTSKRETLNISDSSEKAIMLAIENSRQKHKKSLGNLFTFFHIAVSMYKSYEEDKKYIVVPYNSHMSDRLKDLVVHFISLRSLIQCYYSYGLDGDFDNFSPDIVNAKDMFFKMLERFEEDGDHKTPTHKEKELIKYVRQGGDNNIGFLRENYIDNLVKNQEKFREWRDQGKGTLVPVT